LQGDAVHPFVLRETLEGSELGFMHAK
jgi:hypothetical protein